MKCCNSILNKYKFCPEHGRQQSFRKSGYHAPVPPPSSQNQSRNGLQIQDGGHLTCCHLGYLLSLRTGSGRSKRRAIGACTHSPKSPMSASKIWTQSGDWWIVIIHDVMLVFTSGIDKNQNGGKERRSSSRGFRAFIKLFEV